MATEPPPAPFAAGVPLWRRRDGGWSNQPLRGTGRVEGRWLPLPAFQAMERVAEAARVLAKRLGDCRGMHLGVLAMQDLRYLNDAIAALPASPSPARDGAGG